MKKILFMAVALVMATATFTSCSKDDDPVAPVIENTDGTSFTVKQGEALTISPKYTSVDASTTYEWKDGDGKVIASTSTLSLTNKEVGAFFYTVTASNGSASAKVVYNVDVEKNLVTVDFEGDEWNKLIDSPQYGGPLLYGTDTTYKTVVNYSWTDAATQLSSKLTASWGGTYGFAEGGIAISNYVDDNIKEHNNYQYQLAVPVSNGSKNFAVVYCEASMTFADGKARCIESIDLSPTTYCLGVCTYGNETAKSLAQSGELTVHIIGIREDKSEDEIFDFQLAHSGILVTKWEKFKLMSFETDAKTGKNWNDVKLLGIKFQMTGSDASEWGGINTPTYFALDNVVVNNYTE